MKSYLVLYFVCIPIASFLQSLQDYNWQIGKKSDPPFTKGIEIAFNDEGITIDTIIRQIGFLYFNASISSDKGNLLLYSNGCQIRDGNHLLIQGSTHLNPGSIDLEWCPDGYPIAEGGLFIPFFGDSIIMLLHQRIIVEGPPLKVENDSLFYTSLRKENETYVLHEKRVPIVGDSLLDGNVEAVKALKPGAWWVIQGKKGTNQYHSILIDSAKIDTVFTQFVGDANLDGSAAGQSGFSPDGSRYAKYALRDGLLLFDFNRETGVLSNYRKFHVSDSGIIGGLAFAPNNRFLYVSTTFDLYQFDTWANDIQSSQLHIAHYDGFLNPFPTNFYHMQLGPDCRIYMNSNNDGYSWHVIHKPDELGVQCQFEQHGIHFPYPTSITIPNFPNYRLDIGAVCDPNMISSISILDHENEKIKFYPNPTDGPLWIKLPDDLDYNIDCILEIRDLAGKLLFQKEIFSEKTIFIGMEDYSGGIYFVILRNSDSVRALKVVKY